MAHTTALVRVNQSHLRYNLAHQQSRLMHFCSTAAISDQSSWKKSTLSSQRRPNVIDWNNHCTPGVLLDSDTFVAAKSVALDHISSRLSAHKWCPRTVVVWVGRRAGSKSTTSGGPRDEACKMGKGKIPFWKMLILWPGDEQDHDCGTVI